MIWADNITKYYPTHRGRHYVLRDVSFYIAPLTKLGVIGRNGAGKSTLVRLLSGVDMPNEGRIVRQGHISWPLGLATGLHSSMTGRENARFACRIQGLSYHEMSAVLDFIRSFAEIGRYFDEPVRAYSSGMKARLNFAIAMAFDFDFYIIDELTAVGDEQFKHKSRQTFEEKRSRAGVIMVSHSLSQLREECKSGLLLHEGNAEYFDDIEGAIDRYLFLQGLEEQKQAKRRQRRGGDAGEPVIAGIGEENESGPKKKKQKKKAKKLAPSALAGVKAAFAFARGGEDEPAAEPVAEEKPRKIRPGRGAGAPISDAPTSQPAARAARPPKPAAMPVGRAPFAPRVQREAPTDRMTDRPGAPQADLTARHLLSMLRGGLARR